MYSETSPFIDKYKQMEKIMSLVLPHYISQTGNVVMAAEIVVEFANMEMVRQTIVGVVDVVAATLDYLNHHFFGTPKPFWYAQLTP